MIREVFMYSKISNGMRYNALEKLLISIIPLIIIGQKDSFLNLTIYLIYFIIGIKILKLPIKIIFKFVIISVIFAAFSSIGLIFLKLNYIYILRLIYKGTIGGLALGFLSLSTDLDSILSKISRIKCLREVCDIAKYMERFLFLIEDEFKNVSNAIRARSCSNRYKVKLINHGKIAACTFKNSIMRWRDIEDSLKCRLYSGKIYYSSEEINISKARILIILILNILIYFSDLLVV